MRPGGYKRTASIRKKMSSAANAFYADPIKKAIFDKAQSDPVKCANHSRAMKRKYREDPEWAARRLAAYLVSRRSKKSRAKSSLVSTKMWNDLPTRRKIVYAMANTADKGYYKGTYISSKSLRKGRFHVRSRMELEFCWMLDCSDGVAAFYYEPGVIDYKLNNKLRSYIPDFLIVFRDMSVVIVEIKPEGRCTGTLEWSNEFKAKRSAARAFCYAHGMSWKHLKRPNKFWERGRVSIRLYT